MRVSPSGPHLNSITSQQFYVQINIRFGARASMYDFGRGKNIHSITVCVCVCYWWERATWGWDVKNYINQEAISWSSTLMWDSAQTFGQSVFQGDFQSIVGIQQFWDFYLANFPLSFPLAEISFVDSVGLWFRSFGLISPPDEGLCCLGGLSQDPLARAGSYHSNPRSLTSQFFYSPISRVGVGVENKTI